MNMDVFGTFSLLSPKKINYLFLVGHILNSRKLISSGAQFTTKNDLKLIPFEDR